MRWPHSMAAAGILLAGLGLTGCDVHPSVVCQATKPTASLVYREVWEQNRYECSARYRLGDSDHYAHWCWIERNGKASDGYLVPSCGGS